MAKVKEDSESMLADADGYLVVVELLKRGVVADCICYDLSEPDSRNEIPDG